MALQIFYGLSPAYLSSLITLHARFSSSAEPLLSLQNHHAFAVFFILVFCYASSILLWSPSSSRRSSQSSPLLRPAGVDVLYLVATLCHVVSHLCELEHVIFTRFWAQPTVLGGGICQNREWGLEDTPRGLCIGEGSTLIAWAFGK